MATGSSGEVREECFHSVIFCVFLNIGCYESPEKARSASLQTIGKVKLYIFSSNDQYFLSKARPYVLPANTSLRETLISLGHHLSKTYFFKTYNGPTTDIRFEVVRIEEIPIKPRPLKIAIINIIVICFLIFILIINAG